MTQETPFQRFDRWFEDAKASEPQDPNAMTLATSDSCGAVTARVVLLKECNDHTFTFYTNLGSRKANQMSENENVALCFHWKSLNKQVRIEGVVSQVSDARADTYFQTRPRENQIGAWASHQSEKLNSREELESRFEELEKKFQGKEIPRPDHWGGFLVRPSLYEFWQGRPGRLHDRFVYSRIEEDKWQLDRLSP